MILDAAKDEVERGAYCGVAEQKDEKLQCSLQDKLEDRLDTTSQAEGSWTEAVVEVGWSQFGKSLPSTDLTSKR
jgi:hypothetical protein